MKKLALLLTPFLISALILGSIGCGDTTATPSPTPVPTSTPGKTSTPAPTPTSSAAPQTTATARPTAAPLATPTATPRPTSTATAAPPASPSPTPKPLVLKMSCAYPESGYRGPQLKLFKELIEKYTNGRVTLQLYMGGVLFPAAAEWEALITGAVDLTFTPPFFAYNSVPSNRLWYLQTGLWEGAEHGWSVIQDGRVPKIFHDQALAKGVKQLGIVPGTGQTAILVSKRKEIKNIRDIKDLKIATPGELMPIFSEFGGAKAVIVPSTENFLALSQGIVDLVTTGIDSVVAMKLFEVADFALLRPGGYYPTLIWMNKAKWDGLAPDIQDAIQNKAAREVEQFAYKQTQAEEQKLVDTVKAKFKAVNNVTSEELTAAREFLATEPKTLKDLNLVGPEILKIVEELQPSKKKA